MTKMRSAIKTYLLRFSATYRLLEGYRLYSSYFQDIKRFSKHSGVYGQRRTESLEAHIVMDLHRLEKGMTLPAPRPWFGRDVVDRLLKNCRQYAFLADADPSIVAAAVSVLDQYADTFGGSDVERASTIRAKSRSMAEGVHLDPMVRAGAIPHLSLRSDSGGSRSFLEFAESRSSVRSFAEALVPEATLTDAIRAAQFSPSVCNRQATLVRIFRRGDDANNVLKLQNGNRGFGHSASHVLMITYDNAAFMKPGERNQGFIDAGLFVMSLLYALHDLGVDSCCLNWSATSLEDSRMRSAASVPEHETIVVLIAVGYAASGSKVTVSPHKTLSRVIVRGGEDQ
ncbi:nitroreductase family protein [Gordonia rubripertincta]|uniref:nitroreductase family protein n=1 Tax=Gordonia rubripertincta TaxID=36822 RepID=UPI0035AFD429